MKKRKSLLQNFQFKVLFQVFFIFIVFIASSSQGAVSTGDKLANESSKTLTLNDVTKAVLQSNYSVLESQIRSSQALDSVSVARAQLLPKLNFWRLLAVTEGLVGVVGLAEDLVPFLVPANWFRKEEQKDIARSQFHSLSILKANQLLRFRELYYLLQFDQHLLDEIGKQFELFKNITAVTQTREAFSLVRPGSSREMFLRQLALESDFNSLRLNVQRNSLELSLGLGVTDADTAEKITGDIYLEPPRIDPDLVDKDWNRILESHGLFSLRARAQAFELRQLEALKKASEKNLASLSYLVLGVSPLARGVGGEFFDSLPIQDGLGFGLKGTRRIAKLNQSILGIQVGMVEKVIQRQIKQLLTELAQDQQSRQRLNLAVEKAQERLNFYLNDPSGLPLDTMLVVDASRVLVDSRRRLAMVESRMMSNLEKWKRLLVLPPYNMEVL